MNPYELRLECLDRALRINSSYTLRSSAQAVPGSYPYQAASEHHIDPKAEKVIEDAAKFLAFVEQGQSQSANQPRRKSKGRR